MLIGLKEYHRPETLDEAISLLSREDIKTVPLGGGSSLLSEPNFDIEAVVDLQDLGLDTISFAGSELSLGAMVRLQTIVEELSDELDGFLSNAAKQMAGWNLRNQITLGGVIASGQMDSPLGVVLAALNAEVLLVGESKELVSWSDLTGAKRSKFLENKLIRDVTFSYLKVMGCYHQIGRTKADWPIVSAAATVATDENGVDILTLVIGGLTEDLFITNAEFEAVKLSSIMAELTGHYENSDIAISDYLGSTEYRYEMAKVLLARAFNHISDKFEDEK